MSTRSLLTLSGLAALTMLPQAALAQQHDTRSSPVSVAACSVDAQSLRTEYGSEFASPFGPRIGIGNDYKIRFENNAGAAVKNIAFAVRVNGTTQVLSARGLFAAGSDVEREFRAEPYVAATVATCEVSRVDFSDGSSWQPGSLPQTIGALPKASRR